MIEDFRNLNLFFHTTRRQEKGIKGQSRANEQVMTKRIVLFLTILILVSSCVQVTQRETVPIKMPEQFSEGGETPLQPDWWLYFNDTGLTKTIDLALSGNFNLLVAQDRLAQAMAVARRTGAERSPNLDGRGLARESWSKQDETTTATTLTLELAASYEIDLWGRLRARTEAASFDVGARQGDLYTAAITLTSGIGTVWYQIAEIKKEQILVTEQRVLNEKILQIITAQYKAGQVGIADVMQQKGLIEKNNGELIGLRTRLRILEQQLAVLIGRAPGTEVLDTPVKLAEIPPLPDTGIPIDLVMNRPDIRSAYLALLAADQRVAEAVANKFPKLSVSAELSTGGQNGSDLFNNWFSSLAGNLVGPIFDGGFRQAEVDRTQAVSSQYFHQYGQTIIEAISEVETALVQEKEQNNLLENLEIRLELAQATVERVGDRYRQGAEDYQRVLTALLSFQGLQTEMLRARQKLIDYRIGLYRSLGGQIELPEPEIAGAEVEMSFSGQSK